MEKPLSGLSQKEVQERRRNGEGGEDCENISKSRKKIIKENVFTLFHFLNFAIAGFLFAAEAYTNLIFLFIILLNMAIGTAQECKAKKMVDELSVLNRPSVKAVRENRIERMDPKELVRGDLIVLETGDQICSDAVVEEGSIEVNESLLTGESDAVEKEKGSCLLSGSFVTGGKAYARVIHVGKENYAAQLTSEVKKEKKTESKLLNAVQKVTRFTSLFILPLGGLLFAEAAWLRGDSFQEAVVSCAAALLGMLPKGLVLLISVSLATGVIRLAKKKILVQNLYALENLAYTGVLCLDKTGTITDGKLQVISTIPAPGWQAEKTKRLIQSYLAASDDKNATFCALEQAFAKRSFYQPSFKIPFSSKRKWGSVSFFGEGTLFVGAPERMMKHIPEAVEKEMKRGRRAVAIGYSEKAWNHADRLPDPITPLCAVILEDHVRKQIKQTLDYFAGEGVEIKVISGDHISTVCATAKKAGLQYWHSAVDMSKLQEEIRFDEICERYCVFARATPRQKQQLIEALKRRGRHVAMAGDGVNDLLAMKEADCSIAVSDGSDAGRQLAQIVLVDSDFTSLPEAVLEGRNAVRHVTRTAGVFFIKTLYSVFVSVFCLFMNVPFPFLPIQITLADACIEAYPSFLTILERHSGAADKEFLQTVLKRAFPFAAAITAAVAAITVAAPFSKAENKTVMYLLLILTSMAAAVKSCQPFTRLRVFLCVTMVLGTFCALMLFPELLELSPITPRMAAFTAMAFSVIVIFLSLTLQCFWEPRRNDMAHQNRRSYAKDN